MSEKIEKNCGSCIENDCGLCDRRGILVEDDDHCDKWKGKDPGWKERMLGVFLTR